MVAGARLNRAQQRITSLRPYALKTQEILQNVADSLRQGGDDTQNDLHPLLIERAEKKVLFLVMSGDRGLAGGFNVNIGKAVFAAWKEKEASGEDIKVSFATAGRKAREYLTRRGADIARDFPKMYDGLDQEEIPSSFSVDRFAVPARRGRRGLHRVQRVQERHHAEADRREASAAPQSFGRREGKERRRKSGVHFRAEPARAARASRSFVRGDFDLSRVARVASRFLRCANDGDGFGDAKREGRDRSLHASLQPRTPSGDHQRADGNHRRRRSSQRIIFLRCSRNGCF